MFCPTCQQDVPALAVPEEPGVVRCAFCGDELEMREMEQESGVRGQESDDLALALQDSLELISEPDSQAASEWPELPEPKAPLPDLHLPPRPLELDHWDLEPQVRAAERLRTTLRQEAPPESVAAVHGPHSQLEGWHVPAPSARSISLPTRENRQSSAPAKAEKSGLLAWTCLSLGMMALACGGVLVGWSLVEERPDLWSLGLPLAVVGQGALVIGLLLQLDGLWQSSKKTEETLTQLDDKLHDLTHTTTMLGTTRSTPAQSFYVHMAEKASPHLLLADLKGQLDLLAEQLARK